jgi:hypothetical protein
MVSATRDGGFRGCRPFRRGLNRPRLSARRKTYPGKGAGGEGGAIAATQVHWGSQSHKLADIHPYDPYHHAADGQES